MFGKKALFAKMNGHVNIVAIAICEAALQEQRRLGQREDRRLITAVANLLTGRDSPSHTEQEKQSASHLAAILLREHHDIRFAAVMCVRTTGIIGGTEAAITAMKTIDWISTFGEMPGFPPDPDTMHRLAYDMAMKYCPNAIEIG
ncbi:MAG: hypothetical protein ABSH56_04770 [Bryobacteraceae bacterium]|jgi:hypothetical protein